MPKIILLGSYSSCSLFNFTTNHCVANFNLIEYKDQFYVGIWIILVSIGMVSNIPTFSEKVIQIPRTLVIPFLILLGIISASLISDPIIGFLLF